MTHGIVTGFDEASGLGVITDDRGGEHAFHCVEIEGGRRTIPTGTSVEFDLRPKLGRWEATGIRPLGV